MDIKQFLPEAQQEINSKLDELIPHSTELYALLFEAARYSVLAPGKRLRPLLTLALVESYGHSRKHALVPACALELVHAYSLIHDDLPCMDDDDLRRGQPTLHKIYAEWHALLTGDYLLTYAFELLARAPFLSAEQRIALVQSLSVHSGAQGMIGGQMIDLLFEGKNVNWDTLKQMHQGKTAALIVAALEFGGIVAQVSHQEMVALRQAGLALGVAFQLIDDVLDDTGLQEELGKPIGSDRVNDKMTAVSVLGLQQAKNQADALLESAKKNLNHLSVPVPLLHALFEGMVNRRR
jgi:geranylgeranyl diphosphate synthase type II